MLKNTISPLQKASLLPFFIINHLLDCCTPRNNCPAWTQEFARQALRFERRLEFLQEGFRFFDLVR